MEPDRNHCLEADTENRRVHIRMEPTKDACGFQPTNPLRAGRLGDPYPTGDLLVGQARIVLEEGHDGAICSVKHRK